MQGDSAHYDALMKIADSNHDAAIFFCGMLSITASEHFLCRLLDAYSVLERTARTFADESRTELGEPVEHPIHE